MTMRQPSIPPLQRVAILDSHPRAGEGGTFAKAAATMPLEVSCTLIQDGHDLVCGFVRFGPGDGSVRSDTHEVALTGREQDRFHATFTPASVGMWHFIIVALSDDFGTWVRDCRLRFEAGQDLTIELRDAAVMVDKRLAQGEMDPKDERALTRFRSILLDPPSPEAALAAAEDLATRELMARFAPRAAATYSTPTLLWVDPVKAVTSSWYEFFPRSVGTTPGHSGTLTTASARLPEIAAMGFDIVYLPPIHPIGTSFRKGSNNTLEPTPGDPGSPWAIGGPDGGHDAVHPDLGTIDDFDAFVATARRYDMDVALDFAVQCSPDHPWVTEHPEWFRHRADGSIRYAENPPKRYQDIYPIDFGTTDRPGLYQALLDLVLFWHSHGVKVFRVDNPHTKPFPFWEWLIGEVHRQDKEVLFLAEAFTRPAVMHRLAAVGFSLSYTYYTWRTSKGELWSYLEELSTPPSVDYFRPSLWVNTPDILPHHLQSGERSTFIVRAIIAALGSPSWGMYSGYELLEHAPVRDGTEEYLDSEKYAYRPRDFSNPTSLAPLITTLNTIRHEHPEAIGILDTLRLHHVDNDNILCFSRRARSTQDTLIVVVNLHPSLVQEGTTWLDLDALGLRDDQAFDVYDHLSGTTFSWQGPSNYVRLDPSTAPGHVLSVIPR